MSGDRLQGPETAGLTAATDADARRQSIVDVFIVALLALTAAVTLLSVWFTLSSSDPHALRDLVATAIILLLLVAGWLLNRRGRTTAAIWFCLFVILLGTTLFFDATVLDRVLIVYAVPVVSAAFLLRPAFAFVFAALSALGYLAVWLANRPTPDFNYIAVFTLAALALIVYLVASRWRQALEIQEEYRDELERDVAERERAQDELRSREQELARQAGQLRRALIQMVEAMAAAVELHDPGTAGPQRRVAQLSAAIGRELGLDDEAMETLRMAAILHDVGMAAVPIPIVTKPGELSGVEYDVVKQHPELARAILQRFEFGRPLAEIVAEHHERVDGSGYPRGLSGEAISREARIIAVADTVEAMLSGRPHRPARDQDQALAALRQGSGTQYDAQTVAACLRAFQKGFTFEV